MIEILENFDLKPFNTFGIAVRAKFFTEVKNKEELQEVFSLSLFRNNQKIFLGGGSNVLFTKDYDGIVILNKIKGVEIIEENDDLILLKAMSGEGWHDLVEFTVDRNWWGIENLSLIPGSVGASPMQNIGAYGTEIKDVLVNVEAVDIMTGEVRIFSNIECKFGYRDSVFKNALKDKYFILSITLALSKKEKKNIEYKVLKEYLESNKIEPSTSKIVSEAVGAIRKSKLPDPKFIGNAGSFFKNTFIERELFDKLIQDYPEMPHFTEGEQIKIPSAWLIEHSGPVDDTSWKGYRLGGVGVHDKQALVLVNHGGGTGNEIKELADQIIASVYNKFGVFLVPEVNLI